jgi:hypothetical protein
MTHITVSDGDMAVSDGDMAVGDGGWCVHIILFSFCIKRMRMRCLVVGNSFVLADGRRINFDLHS